MQNTSLAVVVLLSLCVSAHAELVNPTPAYELPPGTEHIVVPNSQQSIRVVGIGAEGSGQTQIGPCTIAPVANAVFTVLNGTVLRSSANTNANINLSCTGAGSPSFTTLSCPESNNPGNLQNAAIRTWPVSCFNVVVERNTALIYTPNLGSGIRLAGSPPIGATANTNIELKIRCGLTMPSSLNVRDCTIIGSDISAFGPAPNNVSMVIGQATAALALSCTRRAKQSTATLACTQAIGNSNTAISWPLLCPAGDADVFFEAGFE